MSSPILRCSIIILVLIFFIPFFLLSQKDQNDKELKEIKEKANKLKFAKSDSAIHYASEGLKIAKEKKDLNQIIEFNNLLSDIYYYSNEREKAFTFINKSYKLCEENNLEEEKIEVLYLLGLHFTRSARRGNDIIDTVKYSSALKYYEEAIKLAEKHQDILAVSKGYNLSAVVYDRLGQNQKALNFYEQSERFSRSVNDSIGLGYTLDYAGALLAKMEEFNKAEDKLLEAVNIRKQLDDRFAYAINLNNLGEFYTKIDKSEKAVKYFKASLDISIADEYHDLAMHTMGLLSEIYVKKGMYQEAYQLKLSEIKIKDDYFGIKRQKAIEELETKYQTELKDKQLVEQKLEILEKETALNKSIIIIVGAGVLIFVLIIILSLLKSRYNKKQLLLKKEKELAVKETQISATIDSQEQERKRFAQDLHDGFGQLITSLKLLLNKLDQNELKEQKLDLFEKSEEVLNEMHKEIRTIAFNLMPATLIQHGLLKAVKELTARLNETNPDIRILTISHEFDQRLTEIIEISLYRILQEWVNNILKYSNAKNIEIQLNKFDDEISVIIEDDGESFNPEKLLKSNGNGWRNIQSRTKLIKAELELDAQANRRGTTLILIVPLDGENYHKTGSKEAKNTVLH